MYKKDVINVKEEIPQQQKVSTQNFRDSSTDQFSKELGQHGYLNHSKNVDPGLNSNYTNNSFNKNEDLSNSAKQAQEPYRREAGRSLMKENSHNNQSNSLGERNISRRVVESNIIRNQSVERKRPGDNILKGEQTNLDHSFQSKRENLLNDKFENFYQNQPNKYVPLGERKENLREAVHIEDYNREQNMPQSEEMKQDHDFYPPQQQEPEKDYYPVPENQEINESLDQEIQRNQNFRPSERSLQPSHSSKFISQKQNIKYDVPQVQKSTQFYQNQQKETSSDLASENNSRIGDFRTKQVFADVGKKIFIFFM